MTVAAPSSSGWFLRSEPVGDVITLLTRLRTEAGTAPVAFGIDAPLGLPRAYAARYARGAPNFPAFLRALGDQPDFFHVADSLDQVGPGRPFYPHRGASGMTRLAHAQALGFPSAADLSRRCDHATHNRPAGAPVFWTLGANQSGKGAIAAWRDMLLPAAEDESIALWPFDGPFRQLLTPGRVVLAETYPADALRQLGLRLPGSKRRRADRAALAPALHAVARSLGATPDPALVESLADGMGADAAGEDRFDSLLGLLCVLAVLDGRRPDTVPADPWLTTWEGWVLGQA